MTASDDPSQPYVNFYNTLRHTDSFRLLLAVMAGCVDSVRNRIVPDQETDNQLATLDLAIHRGFQLCGALVGPGLTESEQGVNHLDTVIAQTTAMIRSLLGPHVTLWLRLDSAGLVTAHALELEMILLNLALDARDAMPQGGSLTIETSRLSDGERTLAVRPASFVRMTVTDTGHRGPDWIPDAGVTDERSLSRAIVVMAVRMLQGRVRIERAGSSGTRVHVDFPVETST
jgi:hypothetical protein